MPEMPIPYCGAAPVPGAVTWNLDPVLIVCLVGAAAGQVWWMRRTQTGRSKPWRVVAALAGWGVVALALVSPLCNLSVALFSARVGQHMVIALIGAPLIALGLPIRRIGGGALGAATAAFAVALWLWHLPGPYEATFASSLVYWTMHLSLLGSAAWLWRMLLGSFGNLWMALAASFFTTMQMSLLGALLTFSPRPLFAAHLLTAEAWGYLPLEDQQVGGLIMWVPTGVLLMVYAIAAFGCELAQLERGSQAGPRRA